MADIARKYLERAAIGWLLARGGRPVYNAAVTARLRSLDLYIMSSETAAIVAACRKRLAAPLGFVPPDDDPESIVQAQLLPENVRSHKFYVYTHSDASSPQTRGRFPAISTHMQYRERPTGAAPKKLNALRKDGFTVSWFEKEIRSLQKGWLVFVEAELTVPTEDRVSGHGLGPKIVVGQSTLKRRGEEYRSEGPGETGDITKYRWVEDDSGSLRIWLSFSHTEDMPGSFWENEEERCRGYLQTLL